MSIDRELQRTTCCLFRTTNISINGIMPYWIIPLQDYYTGVFYGSFTYRSLYLVIVFFMEEYHFVYIYAMYCHSLHQRFPLTEEITHDANMNLCCISPAFIFKAHHVSSVSCNGGVCVQWILIWQSRMETTTEQVWDPKKHETITELTGNDWALLIKLLFKAESPLVFYCKLQSLALNCHLPTNMI